MSLHKDYILRIAENGTRIDRRKADEFRQIEIEENPIEKAEGSARVKIGKTDVIVGVKLDVGEPFPDKPDEGVLMTGAELSPLASPDFESGPPREEAIEIARVIDRTIRESGCIDTKKLCIKEKEKVWMVYVDIQMINHDGNLIDASAIAALVALLNAKFPEYDGERVNGEKKTNKSLPVKHKPVAVTFSKIGKNLFVDPCLSEEEAAGARITISTKDDGNVCAIQKGGGEPLTLEEIEKAVEMSIQKGKEIRKLIK